MPPPNTHLGKSLNFRFRNLDHSKPIPILTKDEAPESMELISRAVPTPPTGMEKEEECEHHLQQAISAQQTFGKNVAHVIPTPEVYLIDPKDYDELYPPTYTIPKDHIRIQLPYETEAPEYDLDTDDEVWLDTAAKGLNLTCDKFEEIIQTLESFGRVMELQEAKSLLKDVEEPILLSIYDYWIEKKLKYGAKSLIPTVKTEKRDGTSGNNPYIAFRRRTEKMQTRKNRKNDEFSYQRMFKLKIDFEALSDLMKMVVDREELKSKTYKKELKIRKLRFELKDYDEKILKDLEKSLRKDDYLKVKELKDDAPKKRRPRRPKNDELYFEDGVLPEYNYQNSVNEVDETENEDGIYSFKRKKGCYYLAPLETPSSWPWDPVEGGLGDKKYRYCLTKSGPPLKQIKFCYTRRRIGRGGRAILDRIIATSSPPLINENDDDSNSQSCDYETLPFELESNLSQYNSNNFENYDNYIHRYDNFIDNFSDESFAQEIYQQNENELFKFKSELYSNVNNNNNNNNSDNATNNTNPNTSSSTSTSKRQFVSKIDSNLSDSILNCISNHD